MEYDKTNWMHRCTFLEKVDMKRVADEIEMIEASDNQHVIYQGLKIVRSNQDNRGNTLYDVLIPYRVQCGAIAKPEPSEGEQEKDKSSDIVMPEL